MGLGRPGQRECCAFWVRQERQQRQECWSRPRDLKLKKQKQKRQLLGSVWQEHRVVF